MLTRLTRWLRFGSILLVWLLLSSHAAADSVEITDEARKQFRIGVALLQDPAGPRYEEAFWAFKKAYAESPSPKILGNLGLCAMKLERDGAAIDAYETYLAEAPDISENERRQVETDLDVLRAAAVQLRLEVSPEGTSLLDERRPAKGDLVTNRYEVENGVLEVRIHPGLHTLTVSKDGYEPQVIEIEAEPGSTVERTVELVEAGSATPEPGAVPGAVGETERPVPVSVYVTLGLTGALAIATGVVGGLSLSKKGEFDDALEAGDTTAAEALRSDGQTLNITTDVLLGSTVVAAGVTAILFFTRPEVEAGGDEGDTAQLSLTPVASPNSGGLILRGRF